MFEPAARDQRTGGDQSLDDRLVGIAPLAGIGQHPLTGEARSLLGETAVGIDSVGNGRVDTLCGKLGGIGCPHVEVVAAMPRRGVHEASAGVLGNVIAGKKRRREVIAAQTFERMIAQQAR